MWGEQDYIVARQEIESVLAYQDHAGQSTPVIAESAERGVDRELQAMLDGKELFSGPGGVG